MKEIYEQPEILVIEFESEDIITTSGPEFDGGDWVGPA